MYLPANAVAGICRNAAILQDTQITKGKKMHNVLHFDDLYDAFSFANIHEFAEYAAVFPNDLWLKIIDRARETFLDLFKDFIHRFLVRNGWNFPSHVDVFLSRNWCMLLLKYGCVARYL